VFLLTGGTAPAAVKRLMNGLLAGQVVVAITGATAGVVGLDEGKLNALAFGVLVPMVGIGLNGLWGARHGTYGPRADPVVQPSNRKIG
jgi:LytS/YehU family sensor histidine kinase